MRRQFGAKWTRQASDTLTAQLWDCINVYKEKLECAVNGDHSVIAKFESVKEGLSNLALPPDFLKMKIPKVTIPSKGIKDVMMSLNALVNGRAALRSDLEKTCKEDDISI
jgi:hypothetical protein